MRVKVWFDKIQEPLTHDAFTQELSIMGFMAIYFQRDFQVYECDRASLGVEIQLSIQTAESDERLI